MSDFTSAFSISGTTRVLGLIGDPVAHSLSPRLHNAAYRALGVDFVYGAFPVRAGEVHATLVGARALGLVGLSVTTPHKYDVARFSDQKSALVERLGAANTVVFRAGLSFAESTDGAGLVEDLRQNAGVEFVGTRIAVLGAGAAAKAVIASLALEKAEVLVINRTEAHAVQAAELGDGRARVASAEEVKTAAIVINATSLGLSADQGRASDSALLGAHLHAGQLAVDLVYRPARTAFLVRAAEQGATVRNGLGMLVHQAAAQVELFSGVPAPLSVMWDAVAEEDKAD